jgi:hypothetical protein
VHSELTSATNRVEMTRFLTLDRFLAGPSLSPSKCLQPQLLFRPALVYPSPVGCNSPPRTRKVAESEDSVMIFQKASLGLARQRPTKALNIEFIHIFMKCCFERDTNERIELPILNHMSMCLLSSIGGKEIQDWGESDAWC